MNSRPRQSRKKAFKPIEIRPASGWPKMELKAVWQHIEIIYILALRDIKVRYKQSLIGISWAIINPLLTMIVFTAVFAGVVRVPTGGSPYPLLSLCALVPWSYFIHAVTTSTHSLVFNQALIKRVYFPRLVFPVSSIIGGLVDFIISFVLLIVLILVFEGVPSAKILLLPLFILFMMLTALTLGLWLSALNAQYRDVNNALPFFTQILMFISPVAYPSSVIPEKWQTLYALNPMVTVINGFRWVLLEDQPGLGIESLVSVGVVLATLIGGIYFFRWQEVRFADVL